MLVHVAPDVFLLEIGYVFCDLVEMTFADLYNLVCR